MPITGLRNAAIVAMASIGLLAARPTIADDWPQWRGPHRTGRSQESGLLKNWMRPPQLAWRAEGLGDGYAGVVVSNGRAFTIGRRGADVIAFAFDAQTGDRRWSRKVGVTNRIPSSTPTVDGSRVYVLDPDGELLCLRAETGDLLWQTAFLSDFGGRMMSGRGYGESPLIDGDRLLCTPGGAKAMVVALNKHDGRVLWQTPFPNNIGRLGRDGAAFSSIVVSQAAGVKQYVQLTGRGLVGLEAQNGRLLWSYNGISNQTANIPTPIAYKDWVFSANGYNAGSVLLKLRRDPKGGVQAEEVYRLNGSRFQNHHGGYVRVGDAIFGGHGSNNGLPTCLDLASGRIRWKRRGPGIGSAAVLFAEGHLYFRYQNGLMALIEASPAAYRLKGQFQIPGAGGDSWAHPALADGRLYLREKNDLWVYDVRARGTSDPVPKPAAARPKHPAAAELVALGARVEASSDALPKHRMYRFAESHPAMLWVTLSRRQLASDGELKAPVLASLRKLEMPLGLVLAGTPIAESGLAQVAALPKLTVVNLELCPAIGDSAIRRLQAARSLEVAVLTGLPLTSDGLQALSRLSRLRALDLEVCEQLADPACSVLARMAGLRALTLKKTGFEKQKFTDRGLEQLTELRHLEALNLYGNGITNDGLAVLKRLPKLRELDLSLMGINDDGLKHLAVLPSLRRLDLLYSEGFAGPLLTDRGMASVARLGQLRELNLVGAKITDAGLETLRALKQLRRLQIVNTRVSPRGIRAFQAALPKCRIKR